MKRLVLITLTIVATLVGLALLWEFRPALELFGGSLAISAALRPLVRTFEERGIKRGVGILIWYALIAALLGTVLFVFSVGLSSELALAFERFPRWYESLRATLQQGGFVQQAVGNVLPPLAELASSTAEEGQVITAGGTAVGILGGALEGIVFLLAMLSLSFYWLTEVTHFERLWLSLLPVSTRVRAREVWRTTEDAVGDYIRSTVVAIIMSGVLLLLLYTLIGIVSFGSIGALPFATLLALLGGLSQLVPRIGPALTLLLSAAVAATVSPAEAILVLVLGGAIHYATHRVATRLMDAGTGRVNPLLQVLLLLALAELGGFSGVIFAPPLAALIQGLYLNLRSASFERPTDDKAIELLIERLERLQETSNPDRKEFASALRRSNELVDQARKLLHDTPTQA